MTWKIDCLFCDDIRVEVGGKHSYMGVYSGKMLVSKMQPIVPKICIVVWVWRRSVMPISEMFLKVDYLGGEDVVQIDRDFLDSAQEREPDTEESVRDQAGRLIFHVVRSPLRVHAPGKIEVTAVINSDEIFVGSLGVQVESMDTDRDLDSEED